MGWNKRAATRMEEKPPIFPHHIESRILLNLPVKNLLKLSIINKEWNATLASNKFVQDHSSHKTNCTKLVVCWNENVFGLAGEHTTFSLFNDGSLDNYVEAVDFNLIGKFCDLYGPYKGVFLVAVDRGRSGNKLAVWNPSTRRLRPLPPHQAELDSGLRISLDPVALFVDANLDFKVLALHGYDTLASGPARKCILFSSANNSWKVMNVPILEGYYVERSSTGVVYFGGCFYRIIRECDQQRVRSIIEIDMSNETFTTIQIPDGAQSNVLEFEDEIQLANYQDRLALLTFIDDNRIDVWLRESDGSFSKFHQVEISNNTVVVLGFWDQKLMYRVGCVDVQLYDIGSKTTALLGFAKNSERDLQNMVGISIFHYKESLVSLKDKEAQIEALYIQSAGAVEFFNA
ncbi:hypothetical protein OROMI_023628 [Orobanche minor]